MGLKYCSWFCFLFCYLFRGFFYNSSWSFSILLPSFDVVEGVMGLLHGARTDYATQHKTETLQLLRLLDVPMRYLPVLSNDLLSTRHLAPNVGIVPKTPKWRHNFLSTHGGGGIRCLKNYFTRFFQSKKGWRDRQSDPNWSAYENDPNSQSKYMTKNS